MKIYKIKMMSGTEIPLREDELELFMKASERGGLIMTSYGIVNCASIDSITLHTKMMADIQQAKSVSATPNRDVLGDSPFAKLLLARRDQKLIGKE